MPHWAKPHLLAPTSVNDLPGRKPGTSTKVMSGILNASQNRTKRAPFTDELISKQPRRERLSMLSFWAVPSSTYNGNVLSASIQELVSMEGPKPDYQRMMKGNPHTLKKNNEDRRTHLALAKEGPGIASAPQAFFLGAQCNANSQALPRKLKGYCHLRHSLVYPSGTSTGRLSFGSWF